MACNKCLPLECIVKSDITIQDVVEQEEFNCIAVLTSDTTGSVSAANPVVDYVTLEGAANDWDSASTTYSSFQHIFAQTPRVGVAKAMYFDPNGDIPAQLDALFECETCQGIVIPELRDDPAKVLAVADWVEARDGDNFYFTDTNDVNTLDPNDATSIAALIQAASYRYTSAYYHSNPTEQFASAALSFGLGQDLDIEGSAFTMAFNDLALVDVDYITKEQLVAITGFLPGTGCSSEFGKSANVYTCVGGQDMMLYGAMGDGNFFDTVLLKEYVNSRITERLADSFINGSIANSQLGLDLLANQVDFVLGQFAAAGWISNHVVLTPNINDTSASDRKCRITDCIKWSADLVGRVHYTCVNGQLNF